MLQFFNLNKLNLQLNIIYLVILEQCMLREVCQFHTFVKINRPTAFIVCNYTFTLAAV